jgi:Ca2+/H+ antiporter
MILSSALSLSRPVLRRISWTAHSSVSRPLQKRNGRFVVVVVVVAVVVWSSVVSGKRKNTAKVTPLK